MSDLSIQKIQNIDTNIIRQVLSSSSLTETDKITFVKNNGIEIKEVLQITPNYTEFVNILKNRPLIKFRPFKNSFTKRGDKILLAKTLEISTGEVNEYIENVSHSIKTLDKLDFIGVDKIDAIKSYVYRHGTTEQLVNFLDYELTQEKNLLKTLYKTLEYNTCGVADYFVRPIHRMNNRTLVRLFNVVDKHIKQAQASGDISVSQSLEISEWAIKRIYQIQHNSRFINAIKAYKVLTS